MYHVADIDESFLPHELNDVLLDLLWFQLGKICLTAVTIKNDVGSDSFFHRGYPGINQDSFVHFAKYS